MEKETRDKIEQLQNIENNLQHLLMQKQSMQGQLIETEQALKELDKKPKQVFRMIGSVVIESSLSDLREDLNSKKEMAELKIKNIDKQEKKIKEQAKELQEEVLKAMEKNGK